MIGIIVCGHSHVATGLVSGMNLIAGTPEKCEAVDYLEEDSVNDLENRLNGAFECLSDCASILVFTDLAGGLPVKMVSEMSMKSDKRVEIIGGVNLGMLIELSLARGYTNDMDELVEMAIETGKAQVIHIQMDKKEIDEGI